MTCFFIDTANNVLDYVDTIKKTLKKGGVWLNIGPLLYHYAGSSDMSIELPWTDLRKYIEKVGFSIEMEEMRFTSYTHDRGSLFAKSFNSIMFAAVSL